MGEIREIDRFWRGFWLWCYTKVVKHFLNYCNTALKAGQGWFHEAKMLREKKKRVFVKKMISLQVAKTLPSNCDRGRSAWRWMGSRGWGRQLLNIWLVAYPNVNLTGGWEKKTQQNSTSASLRASYGCRLWHDGAVSCRLVCHICLQRRWQGTGAHN